MLVLCEKYNPTQIVADIYLIYKIQYSHKIYNEIYSQYEDMASGEQPLTLAIFLVLKH